MNISSNLYSGCYGDSNGNFIVTTIECANKVKPNLINKQIIFVVDESGSMENTMDSVKVSLIAARHSLLSLLDKNDGEQDKEFSDICNVCLITFSEEAKCRWESNLARKLQGLEPLPYTFTETVNNLDSQTCTNMGAALHLAFEKKMKDCITWIILLTDGVSNKGRYQTVDSFKKLMNEIPDKTKIIPLGYTTAFDPETLSCLGNMTYLDCKETIPVTFGSIIGEILTCYGIDGFISIPIISEVVDSDDIIIVPDEIIQPKTIIGDNFIDTIYNERKFVYGYLLSSSSSCNYNGIKCKFRYYNIDSKKDEIQYFNVTHCDKIPDEVYQDYYETMKSKIILNIYKLRKNNLLTREEVDRIKRKIEKWNHISSIPHKEEILRILSTKNIESGNYYISIGNAVNSQHQSTYTSNSKYMTNIQRISSNNTRISYNINI